MIHRSTAPTRRRPLLSLIAMLTTAVTLAAACGGTTADAPDELAFVEDPVVLTLWTWEGTGHDQLLAEFESKNPGTTVDLRISSFDQHHAGLEAALGSGGSVPDVAAIERGYMPQFSADAEAFTDLRSFGADDLADDYLAWRWQEGVAADGKVLGLPTDVGGLAIAYRVDLFEAAGLPSDPDEVAALVGDWDGLLDVARAYRDAGLDGFFFDSPASIYQARLGQEPVGYVDPDGASALRGPGVGEAWRLATEVITDNLSADLGQFSPEWNDAMANGGFAVLAAPSWMRSYLAGVAPDTASKWALVPVPGVSGNWGGSQLVIPADAEHPEEAYELARFLTDVDAQLELFRSNGNFPSTPSLYERSEIKDLKDPFFGGQTVGQLFVDSLEGLPFQPAVARQRAIEQVFYDGMWTVTDGGSPEEAFEQAVVQVEQLLEGNKPR